MNFESEADVRDYLERVQKGYGDAYAKVFWENGLNAAEIPKLRDSTLDRLGVALVYQDVLRAENEESSAGPTNSTLEQALDATQVGGLFLSV